VSVALPGYLPDVHAADALDPAWGNALRDRAPQVFTTQATLVAAVVAPQVGQSASITTGVAPFTGTASPGLYVYAGAVAGWRPPWNGGWGEVARTVDTTTQANVNIVENVITNAATAFTAVANRLYRITVAGGWRVGGVGALTLKVKDGVTLIEQQRAFSMQTVSDDKQITFSVEIGTLVAGAHTINVTQQAAATSVTCIGGNAPLVVTVDDVGSAGAPS